MHSSTSSENDTLQAAHRKSFLCECPAHVLYLWHLAYKYDILHTVRQQLRSGSSIDGDVGPSVDTAQSMK